LEFGTWNLEFLGRKVLADKFVDEMGVGLSDSLYGMNSREDEGGEGFLVGPLSESHNVRFSPACINGFNFIDFLKLFNNLRGQAWDDVDKHIRTVRHGIQFPAIYN
jgi:hypothetical protein